MAWFKVDDKFWSHPKVLLLSDSAVALWVRAGTYCAQQLLDGTVPARALRLLGTEEVADELVDAGLWTREEDGWKFHDWMDHQPSRAEVEERRERERDKKRAQRARGSSRVDRSGDGRFTSPDASPGVSPGDTPGESRPGPEGESPATRPVPSRTPNGVSIPRIREEFERAYAGWPKKTERKKSEAKFVRLAQKHDPSWLADQVIRFGQAYTQTTETQFVPALVVWLNGERWTDELPVASREVVDQQWTAAMRSAPGDPCAGGHRFLEDGTCMHCTERQGGRAS